MQDLPNSSVGTQPSGGTPPPPPVAPRPIQQPAQPTSGIGKEAEAIPTPEQLIEEITSEVELEPAVEKAGLERRSETIDLPADLKKMGVSTSSPAVSTPVVVPLPTISLPLTDDQIEAGLHTKIISSMRWLAEWCVRKLKKVHIHLKVIAGKVVRERDQ